MELNIDEIRKDTKGCTDKIFLNSAGASLMPNPVTHALSVYLEQEESLGGYKAEALYVNKFEQLYDELALLMNAAPRNFAYATSATDAYTKAISSIPYREGDYILTTDDDYISNQIAFLSLQKRMGVRLLRARNLENGDLDLVHFEALVNQYRPVLIAITHVPTNSGLVQQAAEVGKIASKYDSWYLLDASQSVGQMVVDTQEIGCDFLNAPGRKFLRGPRNSGFLYVSDEVLDEQLEPLFIDRRGAEWTSADEYKLNNTGKRFEYMEFSAAALGLMEAVRYANQLGISNIQERNCSLLNHFTKVLQGNKALERLDKGSHLCNILTFRVPGKSLQEIEQVLKQAHIFYTVSYKHFALIDFNKKDVDFAIRFSPHYFNTIEEIQKVKEVLDVFES